MLQRCIILFKNRREFVDAVKILLASGPGGDGASVMSHEHSNEFAGPGGGNGGRGGSVLVRCSRKLTDLSNILALGPQASAFAGSVGYARKAHGKKGANLWLEVPIGTTIVDVDTNEVLYDMDEDGAEVMLLEGGQGGKGNAAFANKWHHSPTESTRGMPGNTLLAQLELKTIADCALVGYPNSGKSSILSAVSTSKPLIASYPFTTVKPHVGIIHDLYGNSCRIADIPGLIEGAYEDRGLGHEFLRHAERAQAIAYTVDMCDSYAPASESSPPPWEVIEKLRQELEYYLPGLSERVIMIFANKMDIEKDHQGAYLRDKLEELKRRVKLPVFPVSASDALQFGSNTPSAGFAPAIEYMCRTVFARKKENDRLKRIQHTHEVDELQRMFMSKNNGLFASLAGGEGVSLVDQQMNFEGNSGLGGNVDGYANSVERGRLLQYRDLTMKGKYWSLTRRSGEKLTGEKWK